MFDFGFFGNRKQLVVLCLGAHPDDIEIGCGGTVLRILEKVPQADFCWVVFSGNEKRRKEASLSASCFLSNARSARTLFPEFRESYFPFIGSEIKDCFEGLKLDVCPDVVFTHYGNDAHQDHRLISDLTWNTFRRSLILEYEIPKYDGDFGNPNFYVHLSKAQVDRKIECLTSCFASQKEKMWFDEETLRSVLRIRGVECNSSDKYAEGFYCRKIVFY